MLEAAPGVGADLYTTSYQHDNLGRITRVDETISGSTSTHAYEYDSGVVPLQLPVLALKVWPTSLVPEISGGESLDGGVASPCDGSGSGAPGIV